jgi:hypothetical protein
VPLLLLLLLFPALFSCSFSSKFFESRFNYHPVTYFKRLQEFTLKNESFVFFLLVVIVFRELNSRKLGLGSPNPNLKLLRFFDTFRLFVCLLQTGVFR